MVSDREVVVIWVEGGLSVGPRLEEVILYQVGGHPVEDHVQLPEAKHPEQYAKIQAKLIFINIILAINDT